MSTDNYTDFHPRAATAEAANRYREAMAAKKRRDIAQARTTRNDPAFAATIDRARRLECPKGFGEGLTTRHWFPLTLECVRCGADAREISQ